MNEEQLTQISVRADDFCQAFDRQIFQFRRLTCTGSRPSRNRSSQLCDSGIITILIGFYLGAHKTFKHYYEQLIRTHYSELFPGVVSYNRFLELRRKAAIPFMLLLKEACMGAYTGINVIDFTALRVRYNRRIIRHRSVDGFLFNLMSGLAAYSLFPKTPCLNLERVYDNQLMLLPA